MFRSGEEKGRALKLNKERRLAQVSICLFYHNLWRWNQITLIDSQLYRSARRRRAGEEAAEYLERAIWIEPSRKTGVLYSRTVTRWWVLCVCMTVLMHLWGVLLRWRYYNTVLHTEEQRHVQRHVLKLLRNIIEFCRKCRVPCALPSVSSACAKEILSSVNHNCTVP